MKKRNPLRLTRDEKEMILAMRECDRRGLVWSHYWVEGKGGPTLRDALKRAKRKEAMR